MSIFLRRSLRTRSSNINAQIYAFSLFLANSFDSSHNHRHFSHSLSHSPRGSYCYGYGYGSHQHQGGVVFSTSTWVRFLGSEAAAAAAATQHSTSDGLTVEGILANNWNILDENESDWKSHATAIAQSIHLIKRRLQVPT